MKIQYIILVEKETKVNQETIDSVQKALQKEDICTVVYQEKDYRDLYCNLEQLDSNYDFVCIIPNNAIINDNYKDIIEEYLEEDKKTVYLPLIILNSDDIKGVLNSCVWKHHQHQEDFGFLTKELALKQIDTTLYGALIPMESIKDESNYDLNLKYYQHFRFLNSIAHKEEEYLIVGIPKTLVKINYDLSFKEISDKEKIENYKKANSPWALKNEPEVVVLK